MRTSHGFLLSGGAEPPRRVVRPAAIGRIEELPKEISAKFKQLPKGWTLARMGTHGEGSCFFHSLAACINFRGFDKDGELLPYDPDDRRGYMYQISNLSERQRMGQRFRCWFKKKITRKEYTMAQREAPEHMIKSYEELQSDTCDPSIWAENTMIKLAQRILKLNIMFIDSTTNDFFCGMHEDPSATTASIMILWLGKSHFEPIMALIHQDKRSDEVQVLTIFTDKESKQLQDDIFRSYAAECSIDLKY